jgi:hypothetical protein
MGRDKKSKPDPPEDSFDLAEDTMPPPEGVQTVVDDEYLAGLGARLEVESGGPAPAPSGRPSYEDISTEKISGETREKSTRRGRRTSSVPAPAPRSSGDLVYILCGPDAGRSCAIQGESFRVGRGPDNDLVLNDKSVSRYHVKLTRAVDGWLFEDLGSENGTYLDDEYTTRGKVLHGQPLEVGRSILVFEKGEER